MNRLRIVQMTEEEASAFLGRVKERMETADWNIAEGLVETTKNVFALIEDKEATIASLRALLFGAGTEKTGQLFPADGKGREKPAGEEGKGQASEGKKETKPKPPGHGRNGAEDFKGAERIPVAHATLQTGCACLKCARGKVYPLGSGRILRIVGQPTFRARVYEPEKFRCNLCGEVFTAELPPEAGEAKYDEAAGAMLALMKYGMGMPFHRMEALQEDLGAPLAASTQWEIGLGVAEAAAPAHAALVKMAAQGEVLHNDDTGMRVLSLMKDIEAEGAANGEAGGRREEEESEFQGRTGVFTSAIVAMAQAYRIALFFTGRKHAGENLTDLLRQRRGDLRPPIQMCDALSRNLPKDLSEALQITLANCNAHGRRNFVKVAGRFPAESRHVLEQIRNVYRNDEIARERNMSAETRLAFHQEKSGPIMEGLRAWMKAQLEEGKVEPNSGLGQAITYMLKRWEPLTLFLKVPGAPLDNNICERALKRLILFRKNSYFFKTENGARVGDILLSIIHTCRLNRVNPFDYLVALQKYADRVKKRPAKWLPWNYRAAIDPDDTG